ncbi:FG-GAP repeat-containing protein [Aureimonas altamirensis DSM 21988]|uniref:Integrin alpha chain n=2 Tax=Aureimonas altamirensis TaxID=370622 RepID=A0A0P0YWN6_9HYPH|nr:integrin alpha [Aureimonas altamirensis]BAT25796.1 Integrin alpha chain [Aureimonas altamirensis]SHI48019.1 FG-GAP repeat-containing protein [Aureimonas altamirensis DSM 21988]
MSIVIKYSIRGTSSDLLDLRTPGREFDLVGEEIVVTGSSASNAVYTAPGVSLDARNLAGGEDVIIFTHAWSDYTKSVSAVPGGILFTYTDSVSGLTERVVVGNGVSGQTRDKLIFSDGSVLTQNANSALRADINAAMSAVAGYDVALTNLNVVTQTSTDSVYSAAAAGSGTDGSGATFAIGEAGQKSVYTGTSAVDKVYVKAGSIVDARSLLGGEDIIYFTGNWSEYAKSTTAVSGGIQFTRSIGGRTETVTVGNGVSALTRDKLVFADGAVLTQNVNAALRTNLNVSIDAVTGFDSTTTTPFLSDVSSVTFSGGQSSGLTNGTANAGDTVVFDVAMKSAVTVSTTGGTPRLVINVGGQTKYADYDAASSTGTTLRFKYVVAAGDNDTNGISVTENAIDLHGGSITIDRSGAAAGLKHSALSDNTSFKVDTTAPSVTSLAIAGQTGAVNHTLNEGDTVTLEASFGEAVFVTGTPILRVKVGTQDRDAVYVSGSGTSKLQFRYTIVSGDVNGDGLDDFIVAAPSNDGSAVNAGRAYVVYGQTGGATFNLSSVAAGSGGFALSGEGVGNNLSWSVSAAGDVNGDGLSDILVGARYNDFSGSNAGRAYVVYGKSGTATVQLTDIARSSGGFAITGERANDQFSFDVSNAGDVNGDGLGDLLVGAWNNPTTATNAGRAYLIFGRTDGAMGGTSVDVLGDASANALGDSGTAMTIVAGAGDDVVTLSAAGSIAYGGAGNDTIHINGAMISALSAKYGAGGNVGQLATIGGGSGIDTLTLDGAGLTLDLTQVSNASASLPNGSSRITSVERVDLTGTGNNTLKLSLNDVLDMSEANLFATTGRHQLMVTGDAGDTVQLAGTSSWTKSGTVDYAGGTYDAWNHNNALGTVYVLHTLTVLPV